MTDILRVVIDTNHIMSAILSDRGASSKLICEVPHSVGKNGEHIEKTGLTMKWSGVDKKATSSEMECLT